MTKRENITEGIGSVPSSSTFLSFDEVCARNTHKCVH